MGINNRRILTICLGVLFGIITGCGRENQNQSLFNQFSIHSEALQEDRTVHIQLPQNYFDPARADCRYPILVLLDGKAHLNAAHRAVKTLAEEYSNSETYSEYLILAIENSDRERDFTMQKLKTVRPNTMGGGKHFLQFIQRELLPHIEKHFRTTSNRVLVGHSLGGLFTINAFRDNDSEFNAYLAIDPSIWWDEEIMKNKVDSIPQSALRRKLYLATANQGEQNYDRNKARHDAFITLLHQRAGKEAPYHLRYFEHENHRSIPDTAIYAGLKFLQQ